EISPSSLYDSHAYYGFSHYSLCDGTKPKRSIFRPGSSTSWFLASQSSPGRGGCGQNPLACRATEGKKPLRFLASRPPAMTCDKNPKVCQASGSAGSDCCNKKCVDRNTDTANCGKCGGNGITQRFAAKLCMNTNYHDAPDGSLLLDL
ncbi:unnamed protein product, partial [Prunus brigantina]